ncbi:MAG TPA: hypothetical protein VGD45_28270 [Steroidobacter sp.]|uniref:hypothetical protein n=1 Tax=Steroidobacter sp. TaxID=1978227 RepID=UPI002ED791AE
MNNPMRSLWIAATCLCSALASAQQQDFSKVQIKITKVSGNVYIIEGAGGNIAASVGEDGIVIVDEPMIRETIPVIWTRYKSSLISGARMSLPRNSSTSSVRSIIATLDRSDAMAEAAR